MWSFFSRDATKDFPYTLEDHVHGTDQSLWNLHNGKHKVTQEEVSVFVFDVKANSESQVQLAKSAFKKIKTLRHPNILTYINGLESEKLLYVVTERVVPLSLWLQDSHHTATHIQLAISYGLHQIVKGLGFLVGDCNLIHNNVCLASVYVDRAGEWRLAGVDYMYPASGLEAVPPVKTLPALEKYDPPEKVGSRRSPNTWSTDMWGLGCLIWEVFNGNMVSKNSLKHLDKIPEKLVPHYCALVGANPASRPSPTAFIDACRAQGAYFDNAFINTLLFIEQIQIKEAAEKSAFFSSLPPILDSFPQQACRHKVLPLLLHAFEFANADSSVLAPLFKLGKLLNPEEYQKMVVPCIVKLFSSSDRATRVKLLQQVELFVEHLSGSIINEQIFANVAMGFMDTNPVVREHTIKSMLHLAPKLNYKNLNEELLKHFARLQSKDEQGGIRTNTTVCLGKIACYLHPQTRQKVLFSALSRALKDPFPPARQAGVLAMTATHNLFTLRDSSYRLLPLLASLSMDPEKCVRDQVFKAIKCFLSKLEKVSENGELLAEMEKDVLTGGSAASAGSAGWTGWAVSGMSSLTSKIYRSKAGGPGTPGANVTPSSPPESVTTGTPTAVQGMSTTPPSRRAEPITTPQPTPMTATPQEAPTPWGQPLGQPEGYPEGGVVRDEWGADDWSDDDWGQMDDMSSAKEDTSRTQPPGDGCDNNWDDVGDNSMKSDWQEPAPNRIGIKEDVSPWGQVDFAPVDEHESASSYDWGNNDNSDNFFSSMLTDTKKKPSGIRKIGGTPATTTDASNRGQRSAPNQHAPTTMAHKSQTPSPQQPVASSTTMDAFSDWGSDWQEIDDTAPTLSKAEMAPQSREEKRQQRQKEILEKRAARQSSGAMKLGAKKTNPFS